MSTADAFSAEVAFEEAFRQANSFVQNPDELKPADVPVVRNRLHTEKFRSLRNHIDRPNQLVAHRGTPILTMCQCESLSGFLDCMKPKFDHASFSLFFLRILFSSLSLFLLTPFNRLVNPATHRPYRTHGAMDIEPHAHASGTSPAPSRS